VRAGLDTVWISTLPISSAFQTAVDYSATGNANDCLIASKRNFYMAIFSTLKKPDFLKKIAGGTISEIFLQKKSRKFPPAS
jgi:hypothetical protein